MYADTGVAGVGNEGIDSWLQYALRTWTQYQHEPSSAYGPDTPTVAAEA
jgi:hypothetical protein